MARGENNMAIQKKSPRPKAIELRDERAIVKGYVKVQTLTKSGM